MPVWTHDPQADEPTPSNFGITPDEAFAAPEVRQRMKAERLARMQREQDAEDCVLERQYAFPVDHVPYDPEKKTRCIHQTLPTGMSCLCFVEHPQSEYLRPVCKHCWRHDCSMPMFAGPVFVFPPPQTPIVAPPVQTPHGLPRLNLKSSGPNYTCSPDIRIHSFSSYHDFLKMRERELIEHDFEEPCTMCGTYNCPPYVEGITRTGRKINRDPLHVRFGKLLMK